MEDANMRQPPLHAVLAAALTVLMLSGCAELGPTRGMATAARIYDQPLPPLGPRTVFVSDRGNVRFWGDEPVGEPVRRKVFGGITGVRHAACAPSGNGLVVVVRRPGTDLWDKVPMPDQDVVVWIDARDGKVTNLYEGALGTVREVTVSDSDQVYLVHAGGNVSRLAEQGTRFCALEEVGIATGSSESSAPRPWRTECRGERGWMARLDPTRGQALAAGDGDGDAADEPSWGCDENPGEASSALVMAGERF